MSFVTKKITNINEYEEAVVELIDIQIFWGEKQEEKIKYGRKYDFSDLQKRKDAIHAAIDEFANSDEYQKVEKAGESFCLGD